MAMLETPTYRKDGDDFTFTYADAGVSIAVTRVREAKGGLSGYVTTSLLPEGREPEMLHWAFVNLTSVSARDQLAKKLVERMRMSPQLVTHLRERGFSWSVVFDQVCATVGHEYQKGEPILDLADYQGTTLTEYCVYPLLPKDETSIIAADAGSGKSLISLLLGLATHQNVSLPNGIVPQVNGNVLYVDWETTYRAHGRRLKRLVEGFGMPGLPHIYYRSMKRPIFDDAARLRADIARLDVKLVIVDSIGFACENPNEATAALRAMNAVGDLGHCTKLVLAHVSKSVAYGEGPGASYGGPTGSLFFRAGARAVWEMRRGGDHADRINVGLFSKKQNDDDRRQEPIGLSLQFSPQGGPITVHPHDVLSDPGLNQFLPLSDRIGAILRFGGVSLRLLADDLGENLNRVNQELRRNQGKFQATGLGGNAADVVWSLKETHAHAADADNELPFP
jgi:hypothetical protein